MKQKLNPIAAVSLILVALGVCFAVMWRASEAPKWNRLPPSLQIGPPGKAAMPPKAHSHGGATTEHGSTAQPAHKKLLARPKGGAGSVGESLGTEAGRAPQKAQ